jgi:hypothetical protein
VPDDLSAAGDELAALRAASARLREANARLRQVVDAKDTEIAALRAAMAAGQARQAEVIRRLELRVAELERRTRRLIAVAGTAVAVLLPVVSCSAAPGTAPTAATTPANGITCACAYHFAASAPAHKHRIGYSAASQNRYQGGRCGLHGAGSPDYCRRAL